MPVRHSIRDEARLLVAAGDALAVVTGCLQRLLYGSSSSPLAALCSRLVGGACWRCQPAAYCVLRPDSLVLQAVPLAVDSGWRLETLLAWLFVVAAVLLCALNSSAARWLAMPRGRLQKLLLWIFVVAFGSFMCRTRRQRWLALPACCSLRDGTRQLDAASHALTVDGGGVCRGCLCGSSSSPWCALCSQLVGGDCWQCRYAAGYVTRLNSSL